MGRVVLPGSSRPRGQLQIMVPRSAIDQALELVGRCQVPGCGARFYKGQEAAWQRHVGECARANLDLIREDMQRLPVFDDWDPEVSAHLRDVGRRMLRERRLTIKPHETAGHS